MKYFLLVSVFCCAIHIAFAQTEWPKEITPQVLEQIKAEIEKKIPAFKQSLIKQGLTSDQVEFSLDTFRIEQTATHRTSIDYSTMGMNTSTDGLTAAYDKLLNKYYNKLMAMLAPDDKKVLVTAQKAWLAYRDAESKLIWALTKDEYSGGGSMQTNIATSAYADLVVKRTVKIFHYYDGLVKQK